MKFQCECDMPPLETLRAEHKELSEETAKVARYDTEGFLCCAVHMARRKGYRSRGRDHSHDWMTDIQWERFSVFGEAQQMASTPIQKNSTDWRDNRDPISMVKSTSKGFVGVRE